MSDLLAGERRAVPIVKVLDLRMFSDGKNGRMVDPGEGRSGKRTLRKRRNGGKRRKNAAKIF